MHLVVKYRQRKSYLSSGSNIADESGSGESTLEPLRPYQTEKNGADLRPDGKHLST